MTRVQKTALVIYGALLAACVCLIVLADFLGPVVRASLLPAATEGFKLVLAALIGALSTVLGRGAQSE
jgi:hypothetical protein